MEFEERWMPSAGTIASNIAVFCVTGLASPAYLVAFILVSVGPRRLLWITNYLVARYEQRHPDEEDGVRGDARVGHGPVQRPRRPLALAPAPHIGGAGIHGWD